LTFNISAPKILRIYFADYEILGEVGCSRNKKFSCPQSRLITKTVFFETFREDNKTSVRTLVTECVFHPKPPIWALGFSGFFMFVVLHDVLGDKRLLEAAINLA